MVAKVLADAEALFFAIKAATKAAGPDGKKINKAEWGVILHAALALAASIAIVAIGGLKLKQASAAIKAAKSK